jgi:hypothetical protein
MVKPMTELEKLQEENRNLKSVNLSKQIYIDQVEKETRQEITQLREENTRLKKDNAMQTELIINRGKQIDGLSNENASLKRAVELLRNIINLLRKYHFGDGSISRGDVIKALSTEETVQAILSGSGIEK